jgi:23S rRNA (uracil1939-C5)-methyltransferase
MASARKEFPDNLGAVNPKCDDSVMNASGIICPHFGACGGCSLALKRAAPPPYAEQLSAKERFVGDLLKDFDIVERLPILPAPDIWYYRNKMEYAFAQPFTSPSPTSGEGGGEGSSSGVRPPSPEKGGGLVLGLREAGRYDRVIDLENCLLMSPESFELLKKIRSWAKANNLSGFHRRRQTGDMRYLVIREGKNTGQRMAILLISSGSPVLSNPEAFISLEEEIRPLLSTFWVGVTDSKSDVARAEDMRLLWGEGSIQERLNGRIFRISPYSFFQTNPHGTERLYSLLREWATNLSKTPSPLEGEGWDGGWHMPDNIPPTSVLPHKGGGRSGTLLDMYCGSGGIGLSVADRFDRMIGVDSNTEAIKDAACNSRLNGITNAEFVAEDAVDFLKKLPASKFAVQLCAVTVDPPRPGLHARALESLINLNPPHLAYVSCNPETLARDLQALNPFYKIKTMQAVDLFPHTPHVETVVTLEHR